MGKSHASQYANFGSLQTEIRIPSIDYARILKIRAIEQRMLDMICFLF